MAKEKNNKPDSKLSSIFANLNKDSAPPPPAPAPAQEPASNPAEIKAINDRLDKMESAIRDLMQVQPSKDLECKINLISKQFSQSIQEKSSDIAAIADGLLALQEQFRQLASAQQRHAERKDHGAEALKSLMQALENAMREIRENETKNELKFRLDIKTAVDKIEKKIAVNAAEISSKTRDIASAFSNLRAELHNDIKLKFTEFDKAQTELSAGEADLRNAVQEIRKLISVLKQKFSAEIKTAAENIENKTAEISRRFDSKIDALDSICANMADKMYDLEAKDISEFKARMAEFQARISEFQAMLKEREQSFEMLSKSLTAGINSLKNDSDETKDDMRQLTERICRLESIYSGLGPEIKNKTAEIQAAIEAVDAGTSKSMSVFTADIKTILESARAETDKSLAIALESIDKLKNELKQTSLSLNGKIQAVENEAKDLKSKLYLLMKEVNSKIAKKLAMLEAKSSAVGSLASAVKMLHDKITGVSDN
ncbi:MAG: hypothetical protein HY746_05655 [Elusimicrobia bacterium]|nr:hypothetical protein [Elusimicrobiota bacterium]